MKKRKLQKGSVFIYECRWCKRKPEEDCRAMDDGYICTRGKGHRGDHRACGFSDNDAVHPIHAWRKK